VRVLVTGADGFVGRWLTRLLEAEGDEVHQLLGPGARPGQGVSLDLRDSSKVLAFVERVRPEAVYHLAAISFAPDAASDIGHAVAVNVLGTANVLRACDALDHRPTVLIVSSAEVYAPLKARALAETDPILPVSAYGATKLAQEAIGLAYARSGRLPVAIARPFNHIGPGQRAEFVLPSFARQLASQVIAGAAEPEVVVGNLAAVRDFTDVRDVVRAYRLIVASGIHGRPLNIATGRGIAISDLLDRLIAASGARVSIRVDESRFRPVDVPSVVGDASLLMELTGWRPMIDLEESVQAIWADAQSRSGTD
jgi:GDP-4-dehydro-6-deoxy-D-mannose reductase